MSKDSPTRRRGWRLPSATYRLQFNREFPLRRALELVPYLARLGVSHIYASPLLSATPGSAHGYDVCDCDTLNPELGTTDDLKALVAALREHQMGLVLDIVPNHMGIAAPENRWWRDILEKGPASSFARYFDIDWNSPESWLRHKVLVPVLGDRYQRVLESKELRLEFDGEAVSLRYLDLQYPLSAISLSGLLQRAAADGSSRELLEIAAAGSRAPPDDLKATVARLCREVPEAAIKMRAAVAALNEDLGRLDALIQQQHYALTLWSHGNAVLNYRRFFAVDTLAGLRVEDPRVFAASHSLIQRWLDDGLIDGLRVDHPDGLRDPEQYLRRLRKTAPRAWIVAEKILEPGEALPSSWPVQGETGYSFLNRVGGLFIDPAGEISFNNFYTEFTGQPSDFPVLVREKKQAALRELLETEVNRLGGLLLRIAQKDWRHRDFIGRELCQAVIELAACFPVYRTYVAPKTGRVSREDAGVIESAVTAACRLRGGADAGIFLFLRDLLLLNLRGNIESEFVCRFQQLTGPAMAKGVEDCAFYCFNRFVSLNEVGGDPARFGCSPDEFHEACLAAMSHSPASMLATSTHDTKRGEDVRARLAVLSEIPDEWRAAVQRWAALNEASRSGGLFDRNMEYFFYQTLAGAWPLETSRALQSMEKAVREAGVHTSWLRHNDAYEQAARKFITEALQNRPFIEDLESFTAGLADPGRVNSLSQTLIKLTAPGVPDIYQGNDLWDFSLMDPDNRRAVDFVARRRLQDELPQLSAELAWQRRAEGLPKLWLIQKTLGFRRHRPALFDQASPHHPLAARGDKALHVVAFVRGGGAVTVAPRLVMGLVQGWADTVLELPAGDWRNELTGETIRVPAPSLTALLGKFPVALLSREDSV